MVFQSVRYIEHSNGRLFNVQCRRVEGNALSIEHGSIVATETGQFDSSEHWQMFGKQQSFVGRAITVSSWRTIANMEFLCRNRRVDKLKANCER